MAMAPMPTIGGSAANLSNDVSGLAPLATSWHGANTGVNVAQNVTSAYTPAPSALSKFTTFLGGIGNSLGGMAIGAAGWLKDNSIQMAEAPIKFGADISHTTIDQFELSDVQYKNNFYSKQQDALTAQFKSCQI